MLSSNPPTRAATPQFTITPSATDPPATAIPPAAHQAVRFFTVVITPQCSAKRTNGLLSTQHAFKHMVPAQPAGSNSFPFRPLRDGHLAKII